MQNVPAGLQDVLEQFVHGGTFCPSASKYAPAILFYWSILLYLSVLGKGKTNFEVELTGKMIEAREKKGYSQRELAELSGVKQPAIARIESLKPTPQLDTLLKVLAPLGYTLSITPIKEK